MTERVCVLTANLGNYERTVEHVPQVIPPQWDVTEKWLDDGNYPPRQNNMSARLQARIPKCFGWQMFPGYDVYVWIDASFRRATPDALGWLLGHLGDWADLVCFRHPSRTSIAAEAQFLRETQPRSHRLMKRYTGEDLDGLMREIGQDDRFPDTRLYASGILVYRPTTRVTTAFKEWWYFSSRYHHDDQLSLPYVAWDESLSVTTIDADIFHHDQFVYSRKNYRV